MKKWNTKMLVEAGIMIGLALVLDQITIYQAPQGGSITAGSMVPIFIFAFRWGFIPGITAGTAFGILQLMFGAYIFSPIQAILEYPVAFGFLGLAGLFAKKVSNIKLNNAFGIAFGIFLGLGARFLCHLFAGVIFFGEYAGTQNPWIYSLLYQLSYLVPEFIITTTLIYFMWKPLTKIPK